ncbi:MAG: ROK family protein, partial [Vicinamibacterales bacterium]|nr:ROK family protein [Vicinamibacterales bacterium]
MTLGLEYSDDLVRGVAVDADGRVQAKHELAPASGGVPAAVTQVLSRLRDTDGGRAAAVGVAAPDLDDPAVAAVRAALGGPAVVVLGAGEAALVAETWCGAAVGATTAAALILGEHITAGLQIDGRIWRGAFGQAASVGWLALNPVEREDYRRWGGLEAEVGAAGLVRRLVWRVKSGDRSNVVDQVGGDLGRLTAAHVLQGARVGDGVCISVVRDTARYIGMAVANIAVIIDPEVVVLGGTLATSGDMMLESIRHECARRLSPARAERLRVRLSPFGHDGAAVGA